MYVISEVNHLFVSKIDVFLLVMTHKKNEGKERKILLFLTITQLK